VNKWRLVVVAVLSLIAISIFINMRFLISKSNQNNKNEQTVAENNNDEVIKEKIQLSKMDKRSNKGEGQSSKPVDSLEAKKAALKKRLEDIAKEITGRKKDYNKKLVLENDAKIQRKDSPSDKQKSKDGEEGEPDYEDYKNDEADYEDAEADEDEEEEDEENFKDYEDYSENDDYDDEDYGDDAENDQEEYERMDGEDNSNEINADTALFKT